MAEYNNTKEEIESSFEFKAAKRIVMQEFPWIKDMTVTDDTEELNKYRLVFVDFTVNPELIYNYTGWLLHPWVRRYVTRSLGDYSPYLSSLFDVSYEDAQDEVVRPIDKIFSEVNTSSVIPKHLKLPKDRKLAIGTWRIQKEFKPSPQYISNITK